jgi:hypothetical protein
VIYAGFRPRAGEKLPIVLTVPDGFRGTIGFKLTLPDAAALETPVQRPTGTVEI